MRKPVVFIAMFFCTTSLALVCSAGDGPDVIVTAGAPPTSATPISPLLFGHNIRLVNDGENLWDTREGETPFDPSIGNIKGPASDVMQPAVALKPGTIRYPGGAWGDRCRWREAVGMYKFADPGVTSNRKKPHLWGDLVGIPKFGTDEMVEFARSLGEDVKPMMQANWWLFNNDDPDNQWYDPAKGIEEAAHWVEYCNGDVTTIVEEDPDVTVLQKAVRDSWEPTKFVDPNDPTEESAEENAMELARLGRS